MDPAGANAVADLHLEVTLPPSEGSDQLSSFLRGKSFCDESECTVLQL